MIKFKYEKNNIYQVLGKNVIRIDTKEKEIADKLNAYGFDVIETRRMKDWVSMTAKMR